MNKVATPLDIAVTYFIRFGYGNLFGIKILHAWANHAQFLVNNFVMQD